ncbi:uncharacterized protein TNCV_4166941 [Trichonephila clavipes]|nr:uncharacterized protein TNCV_4166941 [Trichonephila clavipes]
MLQVSRKSVGFHHGALGYILIHLIVQVVRQGAVIQIPEMGQHFQVDCKKSRLFKHFPLVRSIDDDETSVSLGQETKLAPDAKRQVSEGHRSGQVIFQVEPLIDVLVRPAVFGGREQVRVAVPRSFGKTVIAFTSHLDLTWDKGVDLKFFRVGRSSSREVWEAYQPQKTEAYPLDLTHCTRLAEVYMTLLTWLDDWEMKRDENLPWRVVCPQPWKRALETHVERSRQNAFAHGMPSDVLEHM